MSRSKSSVLFSGVLLSLLVLGVAVAPAQAIGPAGPETVRSASWYDFSLTAWIDQVVERWFGGEDPQYGGVQSSDPRPSGVYDRSSHTLDPNGVQADSVTPDEDKELDSDGLTP